MVGKKVKIRHFRNDDQLKAIGEKIRKYRLAKGLTQAELAFECSDKDWSQISRMERGLVNFSISYLLLVAEALEVSPKDLLDAMPLYVNVHKSSLFCAPHSSRRHDRSCQRLSRFP